MVNLKILVVSAFIFIIVSTDVIYTQKIDPIQYSFERILSPKENNKSTQLIERHSFSEIGFIGMSIIHIYQGIISSQDRPSCIFSVSCSKYAERAIERRGTFLGILLSSDRIQRCNSIAIDYYKTNSETGKAIDPILVDFENEMIK